MVTKRQTILPLGTKKTARDCAEVMGCCELARRKATKTGVSKPSAATRTYSPTTDSVRSDQTEAYANYPYSLQKYCTKYVLSIRRKEYKVKYPPLFS